MSLYDENGNILEIGGTITDQQVQSAFVSAVANGVINFPAQIGGTRQSNISDALKATANTAYASLLAHCSEHPNTSIPFYITTDQHGSGLQIQIHVNNIDSDGLEIANINLGDTVTDYYEKDTLEGFTNTVKYCKNYIGVVGNHDKKTGYNVSDYVLNHCFFTTYPNIKKINQHQDCYVVYDGRYSVKYIVVDDYILSADTTSVEHGFSEEISNWLIDELSKNDGYDSVLLIHWPLFIKHRTRASETEQSSSTSMENYNNAERTGYWNFFLARKNKGSGTFTDHDRVTHSYDFSSCENDLLCILSGHEHAEEWSVEYGLTHYAANRYPNGSVFGAIDRANKKLHIWEFNASTVKDELVIDI